MKKAPLDKEIINRITHRVPIREKAFFTIIRQSGLKPQFICRLRIKNLESDTIIPRKIDTRPELKSTEKRPPHFFGEEASNYLKQYLATRENLTPESLLFTTKNDTNKEISTQNLNRTFTQAIARERRSNTEKLDNRKFSLTSLVEFYRENTKQYKKEIDSHTDQDDEYYRELYKKMAIPFLEIESPIIVKLNPTRKQYRNEIARKDTKIEAMAQTIAKDNEYISSILGLLYSNKGDYETRENVEIGDNFIELWKETAAKQIKNLGDSWNTRGKTELLPFKDIVEELTKTLKRIKKPYDELEKSQAPTR